ncbi:MAG: phosphoenolpyruvate phosphomutase [Acidobacteriota bacterium]|jgi:phosphoenolpyruvate phosphomutase|nr:phosphoenolpyruvate phosphomutase [Acidobacteriota bacterium]
MTNGAATLRSLLARPGIIRLIGAHNALGAKMAERAGFDGVWSSSFEISASHAVPDASILSQSDHLAAAQTMRMAVEVPVIADCDTGYGDGFQFAHAVRRFEAAGVAGVCVEDKQFPKRNSFAPGKQELEPIDAFVDKLRAGKRAQAGSDFVIIARVEALIAGYDIKEALTRAHAYADAGADAVLVHSKASTVDELAGVARAWNRPVPLVSVPTSYYRTTVEELAALGIKMVIYANHGLRCALQAIEHAYAEILRSGSTTSIEDQLWPMKAIFELQGVADVETVAVNAMVKGASSES